MHSDMNDGANRLPQVSRCLHVEIAAEARQFRHSRAQSFHAFCAGIRLRLVYYESLGGVVEIVLPRWRRGTDR